MRVISAPLITPPLSAGEAMPPITPDHDDAQASNWESYFSSVRNERWLVAKDAARARRAPHGAA